MGVLHKDFAVLLIPYVTCDPVKEFVLPITEKLRKMAEQAYTEEERMRTHPDDADDLTVAEDNARLVRDVYSVFPVCIFSYLFVFYINLNQPNFMK
jgi:phosphoenolpyruvate carboxylase